MFIIRYRRLFGDEREEVLYIQMDCSKFELEAGQRDYLDKERSVITFFLRTCYQYCQNKMAVKSSIKGRTFKSI